MDPRDLLPPPDPDPWADWKALWYEGRDVWLTIAIIALTMLLIRWWTLRCLC